MKTATTKKSIRTTTTTAKRIGAPPATARFSAWCASNVRFITRALKSGSLADRTELGGRSAAWLGWLLFEKLDGAPGPAFYHTPAALDEMRPAFDELRRLAAAHGYRMTVRESSESATAAA